MNFENIRKQDEDIEKLGKEAIDKNIKDNSFNMEDNLLRDKELLILKIEDFKKDLDFTYDEESENRFYFIENELNKLSEEYEEIEKEIYDTNEGIDLLSVNELRDTMNSIQESIKFLIKERSEFVDIFIKDKEGLEKTKDSLGEINRKLEIFRSQKKPELN